MKTDLKLPIELGGTFFARSIIKRMIILLAVSFISFLLLGAAYLLSQMDFTFRTVIIIATITSVAVIAIILLLDSSWVNFVFKKKKT